MKRTLLSMLAVLAVTAVVVRGQDTRPAPADPAAWAPEDALVYLGITDVGQTWEAFRKTAGYAAMSDEESKEVMPGLKMFGRAVETFKERLAKSLDIPPTQIKNPFGGPLTVYLVVPQGKKLEELEPVLIAGVGDRETMRKYVDTAVTKFKEQGKYEAISAGGATIQSFKFDAGKKGADAPSDTQNPDDEDKLTPEEEEAEEAVSSGAADSSANPLIGAIERFFSGDSMPPALAICLTEDRLIVSTAVDQVRAVLRREGGKTLADTEDHKALLRNFKDVGPVRFLANLPRIIALTKSNVEEESRDEFNKTMKLLGAEGVGSALAHWRGGTDEYDGKFELLLLLPGEQAGVAKILKMENRSTAPPATVGADVSFYASINVKPPELIDEIERALRTADPNAADEMRSSLEKVELPDGATLNPRKDFIAHLRGPLTMALTLTKPLGADSIRLLIGLGHGDQSAMERFFTAFGEDFKPRDVQGTQVFDVASAGFSIAPTSDRLIAGPSTAVAAALHSTAGDSLAQSDAWKSVSKHIPAEAWLTLYIDERKLLEFALEAAKSPDFMMAGGMDMGKMMLMSMIMSMTGGADPEAAGNTDKLLKYSAPSVLTLSTTPAGLLLTSVEMKPKK